MKSLLWSPFALFFLVLSIFLPEKVFGNAKSFDSKEYRHNFPQQVNSYYDSYELGKTTLVRRNSDSHPECRFTFDIRSPLDGSSPENLQTASTSVCIYWRRGGFGSYDLETPVRIYENGFAKNYTVLFHLRHLGACTLNGYVLSTNNSYAYGYISGREFYGLVHLSGKNYFIESHNKVVDFRFFENITERILSSKAHPPVLYSEVVIDESLILDVRYRTKREVYDVNYEDDGDVSITQSSFKMHGHHRKTERQNSFSVNKRYPKESVAQMSMPEFFPASTQSGEISDSQDEYEDNQLVFPTTEQADTKILENTIHIKTFPQKKTFKTCKVTLAAHYSFFWAMGRGNEASTVGRLLYYTDFVDSFLRSQVWNMDLTTDSIGLELDKIHLETSIPKDAQQFAKLVKILPQNFITMDSCLTFAFTAVPYEFKGVNKDARICGTQLNENGNPYANSISNTILINTVGKDSKELPGSEIIRNLLEFVLLAFGGNPENPICGSNSPPLQGKFFSNALRNLTIRDCIRYQISQKLSNEENTHCLQKQPIGICDGFGANGKDKCDCGYRSLCLSKDNKCCMLVQTVGSLEHPFRQCLMDKAQSRCREPMGICNAHDSVCRSASNYINGSLGEKYAVDVDFNGAETSIEDGTSDSKKNHVQSIASAVMAIFWHSVFHYVFPD